MKRVRGQADLFPDAAPPEPLPGGLPSARLALFTEGLAQLRLLTGASERRARIMIGRLLREADDDATAVLGAIRAAGQVYPAQAMPWLIAAVRARRRDSSFAQNVRQMGYRPEDHL